ncbi:MAG: hypothetical protein A2X13_11535 [Bacteroidetes bacterium GWC2_33_15]|nr:MAG: hypothetical protein A2X10_05560 [Bacteroidetes bacterium GWA2_33_15]OFX50771.1 MAG: hypothetical protein A2X13_11535 [Bacteroidetes bacterium GWC2_33_15]OFX62946.1 MAG: hypothetical protein A2X15_09835 [Bacteroidetes bacterium GWB2_32_14]OFX70015.1 MAG: hypothetical protein A2X14_02695 [Bacteroidetes bacterium GWD2_33_33]HAN19014.1 hypothetical protein [Bacteroidales bacterium]
MGVQRKIQQLKLVIILFSILFSGKVALSQSNYLYKRISVSFTNIPLEKALTKISDAGNFTFSYNSKNFNEQELVTLNISNKTVAKSLDLLFDNSVRYKVVGSHVVLTKKNVQNSPSSENLNEYILTGYILNSKTGEKIKEATIYEINGRIVSLSDSTGFYSLNIPSDINIQGLSYSKQGFMDTIIMVEAMNKRNLNIYLSPDNSYLEKLEAKSVNLKLADFHNRQVVTILVPEEIKIISDNLIIHDNRKFQISLIPYIGTNGKMSGSVDNTFSFNFLAGYSGGVNGFELGGINIVRRNVNGSQISSFANIVGGDTRYFQLAGLFNKNTGSVKGTQIAGFSNVVLDTLKGVQLAGFNNTLHGYMDGIQISGFNNVTTKNVDGIQLTGGVNIALQDVKLMQIGGFVNYCNNVDGGQLAGYVNVARGDVNWGQISGYANYGNTVKGFQITGFVNVSANEVTGGQLAGFVNYGVTNGKFQISGFSNIAKDENKGIQLSSVLNYSKKVNGYQIALVNVSDTIESGLPIGMFSFVKKGFHRFEFSANDVFYVNMAYKFGVKKLYNAVRLGYDFSSNVSAGYGIGTQFRLSNKFNLNLDLSSDVLLESNSFAYIGNLSKLATTIEYNWTKHFSIFIGPSYNVSNISIDSSTNTFEDIAPYSFYNETASDTQVKMWIGGIIGLSFTL